MEEMRPPVKIDPAELLELADKPVSYTTRLESGRAWRSVTESNTRR